MGLPVRRKMREGGTWWLVSQNLGQNLPERGEWEASPHLQDASPLVLLAVREHVSGEKRVAGQADAIGPVAVVFQLCAVVGALGTDHLRMGVAGVRKHGPRSPGRRPRALRN